MKHPFWIVNSTLLILALIVFIYLMVSKTAIPEIEEIEPRTGVAPMKEKIVQINVSKIYENDLFDTVKREAPSIAKPTEIAFPEPPAPQPIEVPPLVQPKFLDPLDIKLKGILAIHDDPIMNRAIILDNKTSKELTFKVGDTFQDAQLIRILNTKIIFLRSNGQQEVLYLRESDAKSDPTYAMLGGWEEVVQPIAENVFALDPYAFASRIQNLAQLIDIFGLTTVYKKGNSIGIRVGILKEDSLGSHMGILSGDIITEIDGIVTTTTQNRLAIYNKVITKKIDDQIVINIERRKIPVTITILLRELVRHEPLPAGTLTPLQEHEKKKILEQKYKFAPTMQELRKKERQQMFSTGKAH